MGNPDFVKMGRSSAKGRTALERHLKGGRLSRRQAATAKCYECMGGFAAGPADCETVRCPLYPYMPYRCDQRPPVRDTAYQDAGKLARGQKELVAHMQGASLKLYQAVLAKCYDCMGGYLDGKEDCMIPTCPLYPWMPYRGSRQ